MEAIEPVKIEVEGSGFDLSDFTNRLSGFSAWEETQDFLVHKVLESDFREISQRTVREDFEEIYSQNFEDVHEILPNLQDLVTNWMRAPVQTMTPVYYKEGVVIVPNNMHNGIIYLMSNNRHHLRDERDSIIEELEQAPRLYGELGLEDVTTYSGKEFTKRIIKEIDQVNSIEVGESDEFERQIFEDLEPISEAFTHNITVEFESPQQPEYDILFSLGPDVTLSIEVEDHSGTDSEPAEDDLIDNPVRESDFINADKVFTVCKGVSSDRLGEMRLKSELTNADLLEKNHFKERIMNYLEEEMLPNAISHDTYNSIFN